ncbi:hypothetical protein OUZ56_003278 [Daphnia magna]|uniref:Uncharacterized protein n=1 Tax=Daphnia magna TaxID=35525 RepID=A0ABR0A8A7_9CRUS|nr:hypothetical protein OUZ56_003278 [Daphnia magna]
MVDGARSDSVSWRLLLIAVPDLDGCNLVCRHLTSHSTAEFGGARERFGGLSKTPPPMEPQAGCMIGMVLKVPLKRVSASSRIASRRSK